nr:hypothetical protein [Tanacetum cinerariifolium]
MVLKLLLWNVESDEKLDVTRTGSDESEFNDKHRLYQCINVVCSVPIPYVSADIASHGPTTGASISISSSMTGKTKLDDKQALAVAENGSVRANEMPHASTDLDDACVSGFSQNMADKQALAVADNGSVRANEMPRASTDLDDANL